VHNDRNRSFAAIVHEAHPLAQNKSLAFTDTLGYDHVGLSGIEFRILEGLTATIVDA
jgi:hypothetical protein